jgi:hypothetical protein
MIMGPAGLGPENACADEHQQQLETTEPSSLERGCCIRTIAVCPVGKKNSSRGSQGASRQDVLIGGKPTAVK